MIWVIPSESVTFLSLTQPANALAPTVPAASERISTVSRETQSRNALSGIVLTLSGRVMLSSDEQPENALAPKVKFDSTLAGKTNSSSDEQPKNALDAIKPSVLAANVTFSSDVQFLNSPCPIFVTPSGRLIDSSDSQPSNVLT